MDLDTGGKVTYKCQAYNSMGTTGSNNITFIVEGETTSLFFQKDVNNIL